MDEREREIRETAADDRRIARLEAQLAALWEAARKALYSVAGDAVFGPGPALGVACRALDAALADAAQAAEAYRASVVEEATAPLRAEIERLTAERDEYARLDCSVQHDADRAALGVASLRAETAEAERDTLAAALAEVIASLPATFRADGSIAAVDREWLTRKEVRRIVAALPTDLAAEHDRRVRAEALWEAAACLREHAEAMASGDRRAGVFTAVGMIGARADEIERGGR